MIEYVMPDCHLQFPSKYFYCIALAEPLAQMKRVVGSTILPFFHR